jgi:phosphoglycerol transferase MdoB-like AlkP superfamily enzyme
LYAKDIFTYFDLSAIIEVVQQDSNNNIVLLTIGLILVVLLFLFIHKNIKIVMFDKLYMTTLFFIFIYFSFFIKNIDYVNDVHIRNVVEINFSSKESVKYSQEYIDWLDKQNYNFEELSCNNNGLNKKKNIILVAVESLSMYQSELFSGLNNWTPNIDKLAKENHYFTNFFANNFPSLEGRLALLTGEKTFREIKQFEFRNRVGYWNSQRNLPTMLKAYGYHTSFLDGANLKFTKTGEFMNGIGFDHVEGQEYEGYDGVPRYGFKSVADDILYNRVIDFVSKETEPYFSTIITVTTHAPFLDPATRKPSIEKATKFADNAVYEFYQKLEDNHFFDNGILIITSDHRSMTPVLNNERQRFGKKAVSLIPLIIIDKDYQGPNVSDEYLQQSDLLNSIEYYVSDNHCFRKDEGNVFSNPVKPSQCIYHNRGDYRDQVDVYCENGQQQATIQLDGDDTTVINGSLKNEKEITEFINFSRIEAQRRHDVFLKNKDE